MPKQIIIFAKIMILIFCFIGIVHEVMQVISYDVLNLKKSKTSVVYFISLFIFALLYQKTNLFNTAMINIKSKVFWMLFLLYFFLEILIYAVLFGDLPQGSKIHGFAPFNLLIAFWLWAITLITVFGISHLGIINKLRA